MISSFHTLANDLIIPAFVVANLAIGFWANRKAKVNSFEDYALTSRSLPTGVLAMTLLGTFVATGDLAAPGYVFHYGLLESMALIFSVLSFFAIGTMIAPYLVYFRESITTGDLMGRFYGKKAQIATGVFSIGISLLMIISQMRAIGEIGILLLGWSPKMTIYCFGSILLLYSIWGGIKPISYTDVLQMIGLFITLTLVVHLLLGSLGGMQNVFRNISPQKMALLKHPRFFYKVKSGIFWMLFPTWLLSPPIVQRMLIAQNKRQVRTMFYVSGFLYFIIGCMLVSIGLGAIFIHENLGLNGTSGSLLLKMILLLFRENELLLKITGISLIGVLMATVDSYLHAVGVMIVHDIVDPIRQLRKKERISSMTKVMQTRIIVCLIGITSILASTWKASELENKDIYTYIVLISAMIIIPMIIGIVGIKTDKVSWINFCGIYILTFMGLKWLDWHLYDRFLVSLPSATCAYFLTHLIRNRGLVTLRRSELTVAERLWLPSWAGFTGKVTSYLKAPMHLPTLADRKVVSTPTHSLAFSMLIFALYTFFSIFSSGGMAAAHFMAGIQFVGITLCCGLMLQGIWPARLKPYFPLYWFVTLLYCLPFGGTLAFLRVHEGNFAFVAFLASFILLGYLVDSKSFFTLSVLGFTCAIGVWRLAIGVLPPNFWYGDDTIKAFCLLAILGIAILLFGRSKEARTSERLYWNRIASSILGHDLRGSTQMLGGVGDILGRTFEIGEPSTNGKGEKGYWLPFAQSQFLAQFSTDMSKKAASTSKEISNFLAFIQDQIMGTFEQEAVSMRAMVEEGVEKIEAKVKSSRVKLTLEATKDFEAKVLSGIFPNVIFNLLMNATTHGKASEVKVTIDGEARTITVWDNGEGIPSDVLPRIFDLSYSTAKHGKENSGVGLAFVKMVLDASGAKIACHSRAGKGSFTEFVMTFEKA